MNPWDVFNWVAAIAASVAVAAVAVGIAVAAFRRPSKDGDQHIIGGGR